MALRIRRGLEADRLSVTYELGEFVYITDTELLWIGDGVTPGGLPVDKSEESDELAIAYAIALG